MRAKSKENEKVLVDIMSTEQNKFLLSRALRKSHNIRNEFCKIRFETIAEVNSAECTDQQNKTESKDTATQDEDNT